MCVDLERIIETIPRILIVGGYGAVGHWLAEELGSEYPGRVRIGGRDEARAADLCRRIGKGTEAVRVDITREHSLSAALEGVSIVVNCVPLADGRPLRWAVERGVDWIDITPGRRFLDEALDLHETALRSGSTVLLCAGLVPGLSNLMAASGVRELGGAEEIRTWICIGAGDEFGPGALDFLGSEHLPAPVPVTLPSFMRRRRGYAWELPDAQFHSRTLGVKSASTRLTVDPPWASALLIRIDWAQRHLGARLRTPLMAALRFILRSRSGGVSFARLGLLRAHHRFVVLTEVRGSGHRKRFLLAGENQSRATAVATAAMMAAVRGGSHRCGVFFPEQLCDPAMVFDLIRTRGLVVKQ